MRNFIFLTLFFLSACATQPSKEDEAAKAEVPAHFEPVAFSDLPGWRNDDLAAAVPAFRKSCARMAKQPADKPVGTVAQAGTFGDWQAVCLALEAAQPASSEDVRVFLESHFQPYAVSAGAEPEGLFTGYYESALRGSLTRKGPYLYPLHRRPDDLVMVDLGEFREELKGQRIAGRVRDGNLKPYEDRASIVAGIWPHTGVEDVLVWLDDPVDAFFVQIQGSGAVQLDDGSIMRIGYAGQNGHPYYAVGRELIKRGALSKENVSMQSIRAWLEANPDQAAEIMNTNKSYVFFRAQEKEGAEGAEGVVLTPGRSLAIDRTVMPYGMPLWLDVASPDARAEPIRRLVMAQDTGGAIRGAVRGDLFWGFGPEAERQAGQMKSKGRYWALLPKSASAR